MSIEILHFTVRGMLSRKTSVYFGKNENNEYVEVHFSKQSIADYYKDQIVEDELIIEVNNVPETFKIYVTPFSLNKGIFDPANNFCNIYIDEIKRYFEVYKLDYELTGLPKTDYYAKSGNTLMVVGFGYTKEGNLRLTPTLDERWHYVVE